MGYRWRFSLPNASSILMKKLLTIALTLVVLAAFLDLSLGRETDGEGKAHERTYGAPGKPTPEEEPGPPSTAKENPCTELG